jgi:hypothetical protein
LWRARCSVTGTPGSGGGPEKPTNGNIGRALRVDLTAPTATSTTNPYAVLPPQPLTVGGFVVVAIVGVDDAIPAPGQFL